MSTSDGSRHRFVPQWAGTVRCKIKVRSRRDGQGIERRGKRTLGAVAPLQIQWLIVYVATTTTTCMILDYLHRTARITNQIRSKYFDIHRQSWGFALLIIPCVQLVLQDPLKSTPKCAWNWFVFRYDTKNCQRAVNLSWLREKIRCCFEYLDEIRSTLLPWWNDWVWSLNVPLLIYVVFGYIKWDWWCMMLLANLYKKRKTKEVHVFQSNWAIARRVLIAFRFCLTRYTQRACETCSSVGAFLLEYDEGDICFHQFPQLVLVENRSKLEEPNNICFHWVN